jgi:hypothetical protein
MLKTLEDKMNPPLVIPTGYRRLKKGEILQKSDKLKFGEDWNEITEISIGDTVNNYDGYIRKEQR